jgi:hypothetical protein
VISNKSFQGNVCQINLNHHNIAQVTEEKDTQIHWICSAVYDESNPTRQEIKYVERFYCCQRSRYDSCDCNFAICETCYDKKRPVGVTVATMTERAKECYHEHHNLAVETDPWWCNPDYKWKGKQCFFTDEWFFRPRSCALCNSFFVFAQAGTRLPPMPKETSELFKLIDRLHFPTPSKSDAHHTVMDRGLKVYDSLIEKVKELFPSRLVVNSR